MKKFELLDTDGNVISMDNVSTDVKSLIYLLEYARKREFVLGPTVQVGNVIAQVKDPGLLEKLGRGVAPETDIWTAHGHSEE